MKFYLAAAFTGVVLCQQNQTRAGKGKSNVVTLAPTTNVPTAAAQLPLYLTMPMQPGQVWDGSAWVFPSTTTAPTQQPVQQITTTTTEQATTAVSQQLVTQQPYAQNVAQEPYYAQSSTQQPYAQNVAQQPYYAQSSTQQGSQPQTVQIVDSSISASTGPQISVAAEDTSCRNAGVGALWCAAKRKCLRAWEEPCPQFGEDVQTHVQVKSPGNVAPVVPVVTTTTPTLYALSQPAQVPLYPTATSTYSQAPLYPQTGASIYPATTSIYPNTAVASSVYNTAVTSPIYNTAATTSVYNTAITSPIYPTAIASSAASLYVPRSASAVGIYAPVQTAPAGSARDSNGCITSGGYSYCPSLDRCVRLWETACPAAATSAPTPIAAPIVASASVSGLIGGQRDAGGCALGGGYTFCAPLNRCVRVWETPCPASTTSTSATSSVASGTYAAAAVPVAAPIAAPVASFGGQLDAGGCLTGAGYSFCASLNRCVRVWETPCPA